jgi:hypothetical protein
MESFRKEIMISIKWVPQKSIADWSCIYLLVIKFNRKMKNKTLSAYNFLACSHTKSDPNNLPIQKTWSRIIFHHYLGKSTAPVNG